MSGKGLNPQAEQYMPPTSAKEVENLGWEWIDIIFFTGTYNSGNPVTHVGIYAGNGQMIHAGDPIKYSSINTPYWQSHFYAFGRLPGH